MSTFRVGDDTFRTSSFSDTDWTRQCVGAVCDGTHGKLADSVTQDVVLTFPTDEFAAFLAGLDEF